MAHYAHPMSDRVKVNTDGMPWHPGTHWLQLPLELAGCCRNSQLSPNDNVNSNLKLL